MQKEKKIILSILMLVFSVILLLGLTSAVSTQSDSGKFIINYLQNYRLNTPTNYKVNSLSVQTLNNTWIDFDGTNDFIYSRSENLDNVSQITVLVWVRLNNNSINKSDVISKWNTISNPNNKSWSFMFGAGGINSNSFRLDFFNQTGGETIVQSSTRHNDPNWHFAVFDYNGTKANIEVDTVGEAASGNLNQSNLRWSTANLEIGKVYNSAYLNGSINEVRIYNRLLPNNLRNRIYNESVIGSNLGQSVPQIYYHYINYSAPTSLYVNVSEFISQMNFLNNTGYHTITLNQFYKWTIGQFNLPDKPIIIAFDDGELSQLYNASVIMDRYGYIATVGIISNKTSGYGGGTDKLSWSEIQQLANKGWEIASHSLNHLNMSNISSESKIYEFSLSKSEIESNLNGVTVSSFIFPYNAINDSLGTDCLSYYSICTGYNRVLSSPEFNFKTTPKGLINRMQISNNTNLNQFIDTFDYYNQLQYYLKLNENNGTIAYDVSNSSNNGSISGATWNNDSVMITLTDGVDYTLDEVNAIYTLTNPIYGFSMFYYTATSFDYSTAINQGTMCSSIYTGFSTFFHNVGPIMLILGIIVIVGALVLLVVFIKDFGADMLPDFSPENINWKIVSGAVAGLLILALITVIVIVGLNGACSIGV